MKLQGRLRHVIEVPDHERDQMFRLMDMHFANLDRDQFETDLDEKRWVIQVVDPMTEQIRGFSTQMLLEQEHEGRPVLAIFSGDTIVDPDHWGPNLLAQVWAQFVLSVMDAYPYNELYWFLITNSFRTYRYLPIFFHEYYPGRGQRMPTWAKRLIDALAGPRYQNAYDPATGIVHGHLWSGCRPVTAIAGVTPERRRDPHIEFFSRRNPGHIRGDELCCIARLTEENFKPTVHRVIGAGKTLLPVRL